MAKWNKINLKDVFLILFIIVVFIVIVIGYLFVPGFIVGYESAQKEICQQIKYDLSQMNADMKKMDSADISKHFLENKRKAEAGLRKYCK